jgi:hypothetical protein
MGRGPVSGLLWTEIHMRQRSVPSSGPMWKGSWSHQREPEAWPLLSASVTPTPVRQSIVEVAAVHCPLIFTVSSLTVRSQRKEVTRPTAKSVTDKFVSSDVRSHHPTPPWTPRHNGSRMAKLAWPFVITHYRAILAHSPC